MSKFTWDVRNCYIPRDGYKIVTIDYNNLELISVAHQLQEYYGHSVMSDVINSGGQPTDLHSKFAAILMSEEQGRKVTYEEFIKHKKEPEYKAYRSKGKPISLGRPGGMGYDTIRTQCDREGIKLKYKVIFNHRVESVVKNMLYKHCPDTYNLRVKRTGKRDWSIVYDEVVSVRKALDGLYPELKDFLTTGHLKFLTGEVDYKKNDFGEWEEQPYYKFETMGIQRDYCSYTAFVNAYLMQTPSAVGAKKAGYDLFRYWESSTDVHLLAFIHDEYIFEIKDNDNLQDNVYKSCEIMLTSMMDILPSVRCAVEWQIQDYWSKDICLSEGVCFMNQGSKDLRYVNKCSTIELMKTQTGE